MTYCEKVQKELRLEWRGGIIKIMNTQGVVTNGVLRQVRTSLQKWAQDACRAGVDVNTRGQSVQINTRKDFLPECFSGVQYADVHTGDTLFLATILMADAPYKVVITARAGKVPVVKVDGQRPVEAPWMVDQLAQLAHIGELQQFMSFLAALHQQALEYVRNHRARGGQVAMGDQRAGKTNLAAHKQLFGGPVRVSS